MEKKKEKGILDFAGNYKYLTYAGCVFSGISALLVLVPFLCIWKIAYEVMKVLPDMSKAENLVYYGTQAVIFSILGIIVYFMALMCTHAAAFRTAKNMRREALHHLVKLPLGYFNENGSGKLRRIINESSGQTESFLAHMLPDITSAIVTPIAIVISFIMFDWRLGIISLIPLLISLYFLSKMTGKDLADSMKEYQNSLEDMNNEAVEYIRGIPVVKTFGQTIFSFKSFHDAIMRYKKFVLDYTFRVRIPMCGFSASINGTFALLIPAGIIILSAAIDKEKFLANFIFYVIITPILTVVMNKIMYASENFMLAKDAANRINSIIDEDELAVSKNTMEPRNASVEFKNVSFAYRGSKVKAIDNVCLKINEGETTAFVGPSGGGKSTLASLIQRFFDVQDGQVLVGGVNVKSIANEKLMDMTASVFQDAKLFKGSLLDNIRFSKPEASKEEVLKAAKAAQCEEIFAKFPQGINTFYGSKGVYLSGGEAQRIALARAILKDAPIVILDEATAFADPENEYKIQKAFDSLIKGKTVIMIAHRLSTVMNADKIAVIDNGKIRECGTHDELVNKNGLYTEMWKEYKNSTNWKVEKEV